MNNERKQPGRKEDDAGRDQARDGLDEALDDTFPASDPVAAQEPEHEQPSRIVGAERSEHNDPVDDDGTPPEVRPRRPNAESDA
jgi:hypothetical protein